MKLKYKVASIDRIRQLLSYERDTGHLIWITSRHGQPPPGSIAGVTAPDRYRKVRIDGVAYQAHRVAWAIVTGVWPKEEIDHKDLDRSNNRWDNLREATHQQNMMNCGAKKRRRRVSGPHFKCVYQRGNKWIVHICANGKTRHLGTFDSQAEARGAYVNAIGSFHGQYGRAE